MSMCTQTLHHRKSCHPHSLRKLLRRWLTPIPFIMLLAGCSTPEKVEEVRPPPQWPATGEARFKYITTIRTSADVIKEADEDMFGSSSF